MTELQGVRAEIEGPCGAVARADAVRKAVMMKEILGKDSGVREKIRELAVKDEEIQRLQLVQVKPIYLGGQEVLPLPPSNSIITPPPN